MGLMSQASFFGNYCCLSITVILEHPVIVNGAPDTTRRHQERGSILVMIDFPFHQAPTGGKVSAIIP